MWFLQAELVANVQNTSRSQDQRIRRSQISRKSEITMKTKDFLKANLMIGFPPINESYTSMVTTQYPRIVKAECKDGKLFDHLNTLWLFSPGLKNNPETCVIDFSLSFEFKSAIYSHMLNLFFNEIVRQMENAFIEEAIRRYGQPCLKTVRLQRWQEIFLEIIEYLIFLLKFINYIPLFKINVCKI